MLKINPIQFIERKIKKKIFFFKKCYFKTKRDGGSDRGDVF
jgi:hypothetical protein